MPKKLTTRQRMLFPDTVYITQKKHMSEMRKLMRGGKTFGQSHKIAMSKVGK